MAIDSEKILTIEKNEIFQYIQTVPRSRWDSYRELVKGCFSPLPWQVILFRSQKMQATLDKAILEFAPDIMYIFHLRMAQYVENLKGIYRILDLTDSISLFLERMEPFRPWYMRPLVSREAQTVKKYEMLLASSFEEIWLISSVDANSIPGANRWENLFILPNGVNTKYFSPHHSSLATLLNQAEIIFVGYLGAESVNAVYFFYNKILPFVRQRIPNIRFVIVGKNPPLGILRLKHDPNVKIAGYVQNLANSYRNATVSIAPMPFVVGIQNKILESMACGIPVVATSNAHEGIDAIPGKELFVSDDPQQFAEHVCNLIENLELRRKISHHAREFVLRNYRWERIIGHINDNTLPRLNAFKQSRSGLS